MEEMGPTNAGHFIHLCPTNGDSQFDFHKVKKPTGIPRSMLKPVTAGTTKGSLMLPGGGFAVMQPNEYAIPFLHCQHCFAQYMIDLLIRSPFVHAVYRAERHLTRLLAHSHVQDLH
jgi:hypothetical protein